MRLVPIDTYLSFGNGKKRPSEEGNGSFKIYGSNGIIGCCNEFNSPSGTVVIGRVGSYCGSLHYSSDKCWVTDNAIRGTAKTGADARYCYYLLLTKDLNALSGGSGQPLINQASLKSLEVPERDFTDQKAISYILGTLDDKIELNQKMNQTLEDIAKAIFKSWFLDFDPVRARAEGRPTGLPPEISDLFPDALVDSEDGEIPKGWEYVPMSSLAQNITRGIAPSYTDDETYPVINQKCIRNHGINFDLCKFTKYKKNIEKKFLKPFDTLVNSMGVGTLGRCSLFVGYKTNIIVDGLITVVRGITESESLFLYQHLCCREAEIINLSTGSTGQTSLKSQDLGNLQVIRPTQELLDIFAATTRDMYKKKHLNTIENNTLAALRDLMLPKLISGELRIPDAEKFFEEAGL